MEKRWKSGRGWRRSGDMDGVEKRWGYGWGVEEVRIWDERIVDEKGTCEEASVRLFNKLGIFTYTL